MKFKTLLIFVFSLITTQTMASTLHLIRPGFLLVGTTGDYPPLTLYDTKTKKFKGTDIKKAIQLAKYLKLTPIFVHTTWKTMSHDLKNNQFDIAIGGISKTREREKSFLLSLPLGYSFKCFLIRCENLKIYKSLADVNLPQIRVVENIGGTNEKFAKKYLPKAKLILIKNNLAIFHLLLSDKADVMVTDSIEAKYRAQTHRGLCVSYIRNYKVKDAKILMINKTNNKLLTLVNRWIQKYKKLAK